MGSTEAMIKRNRRLKDRQLKREKQSNVIILTSEMKEMAGWDVKVVRDFSGGTSGLRKVKRDKR